MDTKQEWKAMTIKEFYEYCVKHNVENFLLCTEYEGEAWNVYEQSINIDSINNQVII